MPRLTFTWLVFGSAGEMAKRCWWPANAIALGVWEAIAFGSRQRVPTISRTAARSMNRAPEMTAVLLAVWALALYRHLTSASQLSQ